MEIVEAIELQFERNSPSGNKIKWREFVFNWENPDGKIAIRAMRIFGNKYIKSELRRTVMFNVISNEMIWQMIDRFSMVIGLIVSVPVFYSAWAIYQERLKKKRYIDEIRSMPGNRPSVLIIDVIKPDTTSIRPQVENYLNSKYKTGFFSNEAFFVAEFKGEMQDADMDSIMTDVRKMVGKSAQYGTDKIHLFMRCPVTVAASVGEFLSNFAAPVILHHNQPNIGYENWGPLHR